MASADDLRGNSSYELMRSVFFVDSSLLEGPYLLRENIPGYGDVVVYRVKNGRTTVGAAGASPKPDIALNDEDIKLHHCIIAREDDQDNKVLLILDEGKCLVNHSLATEDTVLSHGDLLQLGEVTVFQFNHPEEAKKLKDKSLTHRNAMHHLLVSSVTPNRETCAFAAELVKDSEVGGKLTEYQLWEKEEQLQQLQRENQEMKSKLIEEERKSRNLQKDLTEKEMHYQSEQATLQKKIDHVQDELCKKDLERHGHAQSRASSASTSATQPCIQVEIPGCRLSGDGWNAYHVFEVQMTAGEDNWSIYKSYTEFQKFHEEMSGQYSQLSMLSFPSSKFFGVKNKEFVEKRRMQLQLYMQSLMNLATTLPTSPLYENSFRHLCKDKLVEFSSFFNEMER